MHTSDRLGGGMAERVLITGASSGIGAALARRLAAEGARLALVARRADLLAELAEEIEKTTPGTARAYPHDLRDLDAAEDLFQRIVADLGGLDMFVGNAAVLYPLERYEVDPEKTRATFEVNTVAAAYWCDLAARFFLTKNRGTIVGISSIAGERPRLGGTAYSASKAAYSYFLDSLRYRLAPRNVRVVTVKPGFVETPMIEGRKGLFWVVSADEAARILLARLRRGANSFYLPRRWGLVAFLMRNLPEFVVRRVA